MLADRSLVSTILFFMVLDRELEWKNHLAILIDEWMTMLIRRKRVLWQC
jgi:hypothetical protein